MGNPNFDVNEYVKQTAEKKAAEAEAAKKK